MLRLKLFFDTNDNSIIKYADDKTKEKYKAKEKMCPLLLLLRYLNHKLVDTEQEADYILFNMYGNIKPKHFIKNSDIYSKKVLVFWITDKDEPIKLDNFIIFRTSLNKSEKTFNEYSLPWCTPYNWDSNYYSIENKSLENIYTDTPSIGFCGQVNMDHFSGILRSNVIETLSKQKSIKTSFIKRNMFIRSYSTDVQLQYRGVDFIDNLKSNIFSLAVRGGGNWSLRFFEIMAYGRIPVLFDTDCVLPFENLIDWDNIIIKSSDINTLCSKMIDWHSKGEDFIKQKQNNCRKIWEDHLSLQGFGKTLQQLIT